MPQEIEFIEPIEYKVDGKVICRQEYFPELKIIYVEAYPHSWCVDEYREFKDGQLEIMETNEVHGLVEVMYGVKGNAYLFQNYIFNSFRPKASEHGLKIWTIITKDMLHKITINIIAKAGAKSAKSYQLKVFKTVGEALKFIDEQAYL